MLAYSSGCPGQMYESRLWKRSIIEGFVFCSGEIKEMTKKLPGLLDAYYPKAREFLMERNCSVYFETVS